VIVGFVLTLPTVFLLGWFALVIAWFLSGAPPFG
jgi:hypothetical protein